MTCDVLKQHKITFDGLYSHAKQRHTNQTDISSVSCRGLPALFFGLRNLAQGNAFIKLLFINVVFHNAV